MSAAFYTDPVVSSRGFTKTMSITSGKGGVGKSTLTANLGLQLGASGKKTLLLDGDLGMGNLDIMFGVRPSQALLNVVKGERMLDEILVEVAENVFLIPGGNGIYELHRCNGIQRNILFDQVNQLERFFEYMLIDTAPGIADNVLYLNAAAQDIVVVLTPDPASLADSYSLIKVLNQRHKENRFLVVCNMVRDEQEALRQFKALSDVASRFLCVSLEYKGHIPMDPNLRKATKSQQLILLSNPRCPSSFAIKNLSDKLNNSRQLGEIKGGLQFFWEQLVGVA